MSVYLDASALVKLAVEETESPALRSFLADHPQRAASEIIAVEVPRALWRRLGALARDAVPALETVVLQDLEPAIIERAARLEPPSLRTLDAIHLAAALELGADLEAFVTYDARLAAAARSAGLVVVSPGAQLTGAPGDEQPVTPDRGTLVPEDHA